MRIAIINYGMGNLASVKRALEDLGQEVLITDDPSALSNVDKIVLPGVGSFCDGMANLKTRGWIDAIHHEVKTHRKPFLGICLGMQMLASVGSEGGITCGLDLIPGEVKKLNELGCSQRIPHVGWNEVEILRESPLLDRIGDRSDFYFVHSFAFIPRYSDDLIATTPYGIEVAAIVQRNNVFGSQFHPEKSSKAGRQLLKNFIGLPIC